MRKVKSPGRKATGRTSASARKAKLTPNKPNILALPAPCPHGCKRKSDCLYRTGCPQIAAKPLDPVPVHPRAYTRKCECEKDCHFLGQSQREGMHAYGAVMPDVHPFRTPLATLQACEYCRNNCLALYAQLQPTDIELEAELEEQVMQRMRETRPQQDPLGMLSTLQALQPRNALDYERPGKPPIVAGSRKPPKHSPYIGTAAAEHLTLACEHGTNECCPHCIPKATQRTAFRKAIDKQNAQAIDAQIAKSAVQTKNSIASDVRLLYAAARKLTPHAPEHDADIPYAVIVRECPHLPALLTRLGYDPQQGYIPADLRGIAEYLQMPKGEPSEAQCALRLLELGFDIVRKGTTKKATRAELERAIARERPNAKK